MYMKIMMESVAQAKVESEGCRKMNEGTTAKERVLIGAFFFETKELLAIDSYFFTLFSSINFEKRVREFWS